MKCEDVEKGLIAYADDRATAGERRDVESHLAGCSECRARVQEFRSVSALLGELPAVEPSFGFDARVRQRVSAEPQAGWFAWLAVPQTRLALSAAMLVALTVFVVRMPGSRTAPPEPMAAATAAQGTSDQEFDAVKDLGVLENYDVVTNMDALSQLVPAKTPDAPKPAADQAESND